MSEELPEIHGITFDDSPGEPTGMKCISCRLDILSTQDFYPNDNHPIHRTCFDDLTVFD